MSATTSPVAFALLAVLAACQAEPKRASLDEIAELLASDTPVKGEVGAGELALERDPYALAEPDTLPLVRTPQDGAVAQAPVSAPVPLRQNPYIRFGERIIVRQFPGGEVFITKPYSVPKGRGDKMVKLMEALEPFRFKKRPVAVEGQDQPPLDPAVLEYDVLGGWDEEIYSNLKPNPDGSPPKEAAVMVLSDLLVVTASYELLEQFEDFLDLFAAAGIPQIELEAKIIEVVETDQYDLGGNATFLFGSSNFVSSFGVELPNIADPTEAVLELGSVQSSLQFDAVIEAIRTLDNVQIDSRGKTVVRAGGVAYIESTTEVPFSEIKTLTGETFTAGTASKKIGVQLYISPRIIGTKTLALDVHLIGSQQTGSLTTFTSNNQFIEVPVIAYRTAKTVVYLEPGQTLVIGGLSSERERELVNKVPILGDIPLLGFFFRSKFTRKEKQHVLFAISPRILQNSDFEGEF